MNKDELIKELERLKESSNEYSSNVSLNRGYRTAMMDAIDLVKKLTLAEVVGQSEQFFAFTDWYFSKDKELAEALRHEYEYWLKSKGK